MTDNMETRLPLTGVTVLDCADEATVLASRWLGDLGARVLRVEDLRGDGIRRRAPFLDDQPGLERSLAHLRYNGGKESVALDLDDPRAWEVVDRLASATDIVIAPLDKNAHARAAFDERRFKAVHGRESAVVDAVFGFEYTACPGLDLLGVAAGGLLYLNGFLDAAPDVPAGKLAYKQVSLAVVQAASALVLRKRRFGRGGRVVVSMEEAVTWTTMQTANANFYHWQGDRPTRYGLDGLGGVGRTIFPTQDGKFVSFTINPPRWDTYTEWVESATGDAHLKGDAWRDPRYMLEHITEVAERTMALCQSLSRDEVVEEGQRRGHLVTPVHAMADIAADPHLNARGFLEDVYHPQFDRTLKMPRPPLASSAYQATNRPAPTLGKHTADVLSTLAGCSTEEIARLAALGIVATDNGKDGKDERATA